MNDRYPARILEVTSYPPPRTGWGIRVEFLKKRLEREGHRCVVLNIGNSRSIPSAEYETVLGGRDFLEKVWRFSRQGYVVHAHANGDAIKGVLLALTSELINLACGQRPYLTMHAGVIQRYFPRHRAWWLFLVYWLLFTIPKKVICNSPAVKACIEGYGISASKIVPIPAFSREYLEFTPSPLPGELETFFATHPNVVFSYIRLRPLFFPLVLLEGVATLAKARPDVGVVLCGAWGGHMEPDLKRDFEQKIRELGIEDRLCILEDLDHDAFLTALQRSALYLRTPITDGVASSVLESLALGIPVVACENGTRPEGVLTYPPEDAGAMAERVAYVIANRAGIAATLASMDVADTVAEEVSLLTA